MLVVDGLGGAPHPETGRSELETASLPHLDALARRSAAGLTTPVAPGVTPGSGPGHLALFGYDPVKYLTGRGVLEALGIGVELGEDDVAARGNLCTVDADGLLVDRRAGRIPTAESAALVRKLDAIRVSFAEIAAYPVRDHRFVLTLSGPGLGADVSETDPQVEGRAAGCRGGLGRLAATAAAVNEFAAKAREALSGRDRANMVTLRGFSKLPDLPDMGRVYGLNPAAIAAYPMYRGLASLVGMRVLPTGDSFDDELDTLADNWTGHDYFFLHYKPADAAGEDGDFDAKVAALEDLDARVPRILDLGPDVLVVAGDHSTPAVLGAHSWHPVPFLVSSALTRGDGVEAFTERACAAGSIGRVAATHAMMLALAHAGKLRKYGP